MQLSQGSLRALLQAHSHLPRAEVSWQEWSPGKLLGRVEQNRVLVGVFRRLLMGNRELTKERFELEPGRLQSVGLQELDMTEGLHHHHHA